MKRILITGADSYIGTSFEKWLKNKSEDYWIDTIDLRDEKWRENDFSSYDVIFHVAGIAHVSSDPKLESLYYKVNCDLTIEVAIKAKTEGISQFIFMSSIIIYGDSKKVIDKNTLPSPANFYGRSKLQAEEGIKALGSDNFRIVILRPPMIYGKGSKGNYPRLSKIAEKTPIFFDINNHRSMLYVDNLCLFIKYMIDNEESGIYFPQNSEYVRTSEMVRLIAAAHGRKIRLIKLFNPFIKLMINRSHVMNKVFGDLVYEKSLSYYKLNYQEMDFPASIMETEIIRRVNRI